MIEETAPSEDDRASFPVSFATPSTQSTSPIHDSRGAQISSDCLTRSTLSSDTRMSCTFPFTKVPRCLRQLIPTPNAVGRWITLELSPEGPLNRNNWFMLRKVQHTKRFLLRSHHFLCITPRTEREGGVGLRMRSKLEYLLFRSKWETYFCVHFQSHYGRLKPLQSVWYTLY
jgi:hypothetical protein